MNISAVLCLLSVTALGAEVRPFARLPQVPVGITASSDGRVFVSFSRAIDPTVSLSVAELVDGTAKSFPPGFEQDEGTPGPDRLLSVQSVVVDAEDTPPVSRLAGLRSANDIHIDTRGQARGAL